MTDSHLTKNYFAHGGEELVIGGKLTFLEGATVEGGEGLFDIPASGAPASAAYLADSNASTVAALREDFNELLAALRTAGVLAATNNAPAAETEETGEPG